MTDNEAPRVRVDYESGERVYLQIVRIIRDMIISGELPVGTQIPSGTQMKREWGVNRLTGAHGRRGTAQGRAGRHQARRRHLRGGDAVQAGGRR